MYVSCFQPPSNGWFIQKLLPYPNCVATGIEERVERHVSKKSKREEKYTENWYKMFVTYSFFRRKISNFIPSLNCPVRCVISLDLFVSLMGKKSLLYGVKKFNSYYFHIIRNRESNNLLRKLSVVILFQSFMEALGKVFEKWIWHRKLFWFEYRAKCGGFFPICLCGDKK